MVSFLIPHTFNGTACSDTGSEYTTWNEPTPLSGRADTNAMGLGVWYEVSDLGVRSKLFLMNPASSLLRPNLPSPPTSIQATPQPSPRLSPSDFAPPMPKTTAPSPPTHRPYHLPAPLHPCKSPPPQHCTIPKTQLHPHRLLWVAAHPTPLETQQNHHRTRSPSATGASYAARTLSSASPRVCTR